MGSGSSNKPIVFVFGAQKDDAESRKKNLSTINTQVAYRAHERRREKKTRQRAQAKEDEKVAQPTIATHTPASSSLPAHASNEVNFNHFLLEDVSQGSCKSGIDLAVPPQLASHKAPRLNAQAPRQAYSSNVQRIRRPTSDRQESDLSSNISSDRDVVWSLSPSTNRPSTPATDVSAYSPLTSIQSNGYFNKALDPFFRLPTAASDREKWLVHFYFSEMGHIGFGTHQNSLFCPDRDWVSTYVSSQSLCFQWVLILAEEHLGRIGVLPNQKNTIARKVKVYGALGSILTSRMMNRDEAIAGIMLAAIVDAAQTSMHLLALDRLIKETGGFEAFLTGPIGIAHPEHIATVYAFGSCPIPILTDLDNVRNSFFNTLRALHESAKEEREERRRIRNRRPWDTLSRQVVDGNGTLVPANHDEHFRYYVKAQQDCLNSQCLAHLLNTTLATETDYSTQARHLGSLVQTLMILRGFEHNYLAKAMFLKRLQYVAEMSSARDSFTGYAYLSHAGLLLINAFVRQEVQTYFDRTKSLAKGVKISTAVVDALKMCPLLSISTRATIVSWLRDWLCYNEQFEDVEFVQLQEDYLAKIAGEITDAWLASVGSRP